jgi:hypothetical protein
MNFGSLSRCACFRGNVGAILYGCPFAVAKGQSRKGIAPTLPQKLTLKHERGKLHNISVEIGTTIALLVTR